MIRKLFTPILILAILIPLTVVVNTYMPINPVFYVFIYSLTGIIILILSDRNMRVWVPILFTYNAIDFLFVFSGLTLLFLVSFDSQTILSETLKYCFSFMLLFFLPGWLVIRLMKITGKFHKIPLLVISYSISLGITSLIYTTILVLKLEPSELIISLVYSILAMIPIILRYSFGKRKNNKIFARNRKKDYNLIEITCLIWILFFFVYSILYVYPDIVKNPNFDIVRHYAITSVIDEHADLLQSPYPWFHLSLGALNDVTDMEMWLFQTAISFTSIILIFTFYCFSKAYLYNLNKYAHLLSTIIFTCFSGLGWIFYYQNGSFPLSFEEHSSLFSIAYVATYFDIGVGQGQWLWLWFRPITVDFVLTLLLLYLMRVENLSRVYYISLTSLVIITLSLVHLPGLLLFALIILSLAIFVPRVKLNLRDTAISLIISLPISVLIFLLYTNTFGTDNIRFNGFYMVVLLGVPIISLSLLKYPQRLKIAVRWDINRIISIALLIYGILLIYWLTNMDAIKDDLYKILAFPGVLYSVPLSIFPELLGLAGLISIPVMVILLKSNGRNPIVIYPIVFILILIMGRIISYVVINFQILDYWERRLIPYLWLSISVLSPIAVLKVVNYINNIKSFRRDVLFVKRLITVVFIFVLVLGGTLSTFLTLEFQTVKTSANKVSDNEEMLLNELEGLDPHSTLLTASPRSKSLADYQYFNYNIGYYRDQIWPSTSPELPMNILNGLNSTAIIYLNNQDIAEISKKGYENGYLASHVLENAPAIEKNSTLGKIIQIPRLSPPTSSSDVVLIIPNEVSKTQYFAYDMLSLGQYNFTTALLSDISTIKKAKTLVAPNEEMANTIVESRDALDLDFKNLIILNLDGYGQISQIEGEFLDPNLNYTDIVETKYRNDAIDNLVTTFSRLYDNAIDLSMYDLIKIDWVGQGTNENHVIQFSSNSDNSVEFKFKDSWKGPKQLILSMNLTDTDLGFNEVPVQRDIVNNASWSDVSKISITGGDAFLDSEETLGLDDFLFVSESEADRMESTLENDILKIHPISIIPSTYPSSYDTEYAFDNNIPFILRNQEQSYDIYYINMFPLLDNLYDNNLSSLEVYSLYGKILGLLKIDLPIYKTMEKSPLDLINGGIAAFREGIFTGNVTMHSSSSMVNTNTIHPSMEIDGMGSAIENLIQVVPLNVDQVITKSNSSMISGMYGFYTRSNSPDETVINFRGNPAILSLLDDNNEERIVYGSNITIGLDNADIISRQPEVMVNGISNFSQFYSYGELYDKMRALGSEFEVQGKASFSIKYADKFLLIEKAQLDGKYSTYWTDYFNENPNINLIKLDKLIQLETLVCILVLALIFIWYNVYVTRRKRLIR